MAGGISGRRGWGFGRRGLLIECEGFASRDLCQSTVGR